MVGTTDSLPPALQSKGTETTLAELSNVDGQIKGILSQLSESLETHTPTSMQAIADRLDQIDGVSRVTWADVEGRVDFLITYEKAFTSALPFVLGADAVRQRVASPNMPVLPLTLRTTTSGVFRIGLDRTTEGGPTVELNIHNLQVHAVDAAAQPPAPLNFQFNIDVFESQVTGATVDFDATTSHIRFSNT